MLKKWFSDIHIKLVIKLVEAGPLMVNQPEFTAPLENHPERRNSKEVESSRKPI